MDAKDSDDSAPKKRAPKKKSRAAADAAAGDATLQLGESGNAYFHADVYDDQARERRQLVLGLYELIKNDSVALQGAPAVAAHDATQKHAHTRGGGGCGGENGTAICQRSHGLGRRPPPTRFCAWTAHATWCRAPPARCRPTVASDWPSQSAA